ncbi:hypothetical protein AX774_g4414 [Zancudomyces culisetae]|uniref:Uncharacterized protein n=1 Tax=Zancudomyces culisetae TaxID=1213189 RepID=A0A1R1PME3_ZANCU|nr:hypothetical protein AX774_g4414 [Zancudomyces culisetae]|eukprot:OMH82117.1 hypothetical protein AX774_g4414 [Zancudomyces culisetae]
MGFSDLVSMLILGRGFVGSYVVNECIKKQITHLATTSNGREGTLKFLLPGEDDSIEQFEDAIRPLPNADSILITFPIKGKKVLDRLINSYEKTHEAFTRDIKVNWILLGTTSVFTKIPSDRTTPPDPTKLPERQEAENRLISHHKGTVV